MTITLISYLAAALLLWSMLTGGHILRVIGQDLAIALLRLVMAARCIKGDAKPVQCAPVVPVNRQGSLQRCNRKVGAILPEGNQPLTPEGVEIAGRQDKGTLKTAPCPLIIAYGH